MRAIRIVLATALTVSAAAATVTAQAAPTPPYTAVTGSGDPIYGSGGPFLSTGTDVAVVGPTTAGLSFQTTTPDPEFDLDIQIAPPTGGTLTQGAQYTTARIPTDSAAELDITRSSIGCNESPGTLKITELVETGGDITAFAADYTFRCDGNPAVSGQLRFASSVGYTAVLPATRSWDFGQQLVKRDGWAKTFTFTNDGTGTQAISSASTGSTAFPIKANTCTGATLAVGQSCKVTVAPHPTTTSGPANGALKVVATGLPTITVPLRVLGSDIYPFYGRPGPERIDLNWGQLPGPLDTFPSYVAVYRGTSPSTLTFLRYVSGIRYVDHPSTARAYYYAVRPRYAGGRLGDWSKVIAARAWPKYSAGMYHRLGAPARLVSGHRVSAGHTYALRVLGAHGIPGARVSAVALNVTAAASTATSSVYVYPYGTRRPAAADIAVRAHDTRSNFVLAKVGRNGRVAITTAHGSVPISVDVFGYFSGSGLSSGYGMGGALHEYGYPGTIMDTKAWHIGALPHDYYVNAPVNFDPIDTPHVTSLLVEVTAYGSKGSGTITGFTTNARPTGTSVLSYRPNTTTSAAAILRAGRWYGSDGNAYPSVSFLNRGPKPVQLVVTILGFVDDNTFMYGQRYVPTAPVHLMGAAMRAGGNRTIVPGRAGDYWTSAFNEKLSATRPSRGTTVSLRGVGLGAAPSHGQLHAAAGVTTISSTLGVTGTGNRIAVHNAAGTVRVDVWSFGRFEVYPVPSLHNYAAATPGLPYAAPAPGAAAAGRVAHRLR